MEGKKSRERNESAGLCKGEKIKSGEFSMDESLLDLIDFQFLK